MQCSECRFYEPGYISGTGRCDIELPPVLKGLMGYVDSAFEEYREQGTRPTGRCDLGQPKE